MKKLIIIIALTLSACAPQQVEFVATDLPKPKPPLACVQAPRKLAPYPKDEKSLSDLAKNHMALRSQYRALLVKYRACQGFVQDVAK